MIIRIRMKIMIMIMILKNNDLLSGNKWIDRGLIDRITDGLIRK